MLGFIGAACSFVAVYAASSAPIPFYTTYQKTIGLTNGDLSMTSVAYFMGTVISLLIFARLSNYLGRRPVVFVVLGLAVIGCLMFFFMYNSEMFLIGRFIQGISCGLGSSVIIAYIVDNAPETPEWLGTAVTSAAPMAVQQLGSKNTMVATAVFDCMMAPNIIGSSLAWTYENSCSSTCGNVSVFS